MITRKEIGMAAGAAGLIGAGIAARGGALSQKKSNNHIARTGRKMDAAWKAAISAGKKQSRAGSIAYHTTVDGTKQGVIGAIGGAAIGAAGGLAARKLPFVPASVKLMNGAARASLGSGIGIAAGKIAGGLTGTFTGVKKGMKKDTIATRAKRVVTESKKAFKGTR